MGLYLRHDGFDFPILEGQTIVGRCAECQIMLLSNRVSRRHAKITCSDEGLLIQDLNSANGTFLNDRRVRRSAAVAPGDDIRLADEGMRLVVGDELGRAILNSVGAACNDAGPVARVGSLFAKLIQRKPRTPPVTESDLHPRLREALWRARAEGQVLPGIAERAARNAIKLAEASNDPDWIEYVFELHIALQKPLPLDVIDRLYGLLLLLPPANPEPLQRYIRVLHASRNRFAPAQRFLARRIRGLQTLVATNQEPQYTGVRRRDQSIPDNTPANVAIDRR